MSSGRDATKQARDKKREDEKLDQAIDDSFPASDPPPVSPMTTGAPKQGSQAGREAKADDARKR